MLALSSCNGLFHIGLLPNLSYINKDMWQIGHFNTYYFLRYAHVKKILITVKIMFVNTRAIP